jgi:tetratricopeptide (TPR) repeat protein
MRQRLQGNPTADAFADLGIWFGEQKQYACAADAFAASLNIQPNSANVTFMFGASLLLSGNAEDAIPVLQVSEKLGPRNPKLHPVLASAFDGLHQTRNAEAEWRAALVLDPDSSSALDALSRDLVIDSDYPGTIAVLENPVIRGQRTAVQSLNLGLAYARTNRFDEAVETLRDGLNTSPDSLPLANQLADVLLQLDRPEEAITVLNLALALHPGDLETEVRLLHALVASNSENAPPVGEKLLQTSPHNWEVLYLNGVLEMKAGKWQEARAHLEESVVLNPNFAMSHHALGSLLALLKDMPGAKEQLQKAIALGDKSPDVEDSLSKVLQSLGEAK